MRRPGRQGGELEYRPHPPVRIDIVTVESGDGAGHEGGAGERLGRSVSGLASPSPLRSRIRPRPEVVAHNQPVEIGHRQGEAGSLQQAAEIADIGKGGNARPSAAAQFGFGFHPGAAQSGKARSRQQHREQQTVGPQGAVQAGKAIGNVVDAFKPQRPDDAVDALVGKGRVLVIEHLIDARPRHLVAGDNAAGAGALRPDVRADRSRPPPAPPHRRIRG